MCFPIMFFEASIRHGSQLQTPRGTGYWPGFTWEVRSRALHIPYLLARLYIRGTAAVSFVSSIKEHVDKVLQALKEI